MMPKVHIGTIIKKYIQHEGYKQAEVARKMNLTPQGFAKILGKPNINTVQLTQLSEILKHDFFRYFQENNLQTTPTPSPLMVSERQEAYKTLTKNGHTKAEVLITIRLTDGDGNDVLDTDFLKELDKFTRNYTEGKNSTK